MGGGISTFYFGALATNTVITPAVHTLFNAIAPYLPPTVTISIPDGGDIIEATTGALAGTWTSGGAFSATGGGGAAYAQGVGARIDWKTTSIVHGRRVRGATYVVPIQNTGYNTDGVINTAIVSAINAGAAAFIATANLDFAIWHRPHPKGSASGDVAHVVSGTMPDKVSWLRTRRT